MKASIGGFDGMHLAHKELLKKSECYLVIEKNSSLTPLFSRLEYSSKMLDLLKLDNIKHLSKEEFIEKLKNYGIKEIIVGYDFRFGKNRRGGVEDLKKVFKVEVVDEIKYQNIPVHSHYIRKLIEKNKIIKANQFLGHNYKIKGIHIKGQGIGSKKLVPTVNIKPLYNYTFPKGVFITKTNNHPSLTFIGIRSTDENFSIETHFLNGEWRIENGELIEIEFLEFLRENKKFNNLNELKKQIEMDIRVSKDFFRIYSMSRI